MDFTVSVDHKTKIKEDEMRQVLAPCLRAKNAMEQEGDGDSNCNWSTWNDPERFGKGTGRIGNQRMN